MNQSLNVFVTVGTDHHRFDRIVDWVDEWFRGSAPEGARCFIQHGSASAPRFAEGSSLLGPREFAEALESADVVITHGGPATVMAIRDLGIVPIVVARDPSLDEHVDGHQMAFAEHLAQSGQAEVARTPTELSQILKLAVHEPERFVVEPGSDIPELDQFVAEVEELLVRGRRQPLWRQVGQVASALRRRATAVTTTETAPAIR